MFLSSCFWCPPSSFSPTLSLSGGSFLICSLSQPFPLAAMTLKLWRHDWEDIREDVALREERWQNAQNFLCSYTRSKFVSVCICHIWKLFVKQMTHSMPFQFLPWIWPVIAITAHQKQWSGENPQTEDSNTIFSCLAWKHVSLPFYFQSLWNWYLKAFFEKIVLSRTLKPWDTQSM